MTTLTHPSTYTRLTLSLGRFACALALTLGLALNAAPAAAEPEALVLIATVNITSDEYNTSGSGAGCSVREAVQALNNQAAFGGCGLVSGGGTFDTVVIPVGTYTLQRNGVGEDLNSTGDLDIKRSMLLGGSGGIPILQGEAAWDDRLADVITGTVTFTGLVMRLGNASGGRSAGGILVGAGTTVILNSSLLTNNNAEGEGGAIVNSGTLTLNNSTVSANVANGSVGGGGLFNHDGATLTLNDSLVTSNTIEGAGGADLGGGIYNEAGGVVILDGSNVSTNGLTGNVNLGGGIYNGDEASLTLINSTVSSNLSGEDGGGIYHIGDVLNITGSTLSSNDTEGNGNGGGLFADGPATLINSTVSGNTAYESGGGIYIDSFATVNLANVTITNNTADSNGLFGGNGGGLFVGGIANIKNTIVYGNFDDSAGTEHPDCSGTLTSQGHILLGNTVGCTISGGINNLTLTDPLLLPLANNGGPTQTHALRADSVAVDFGPVGGCKDFAEVLLTSDQRGFVRHLNPDTGQPGRCDIGAFELSFRVFLPLVLRG